MNAVEKYWSEREEARQMPLFWELQDVQEALYRLWNNPQDEYVLYSSWHPTVDWKDVYWVVGSRHQTSMWTSYGPQTYHELILELNRQSTSKEVLEQHISRIRRVLHEAGVM